MKRLKEIVAGFLSLIMFLPLVSLCSCADESESEYLPVEIAEKFDIFDYSHINWFGRVFKNEETGEMEFNNTISGFEVNFYGTSLTAEIAAQGGAGGFCFLSVFLDGETDPQKASALELKNGTYSYTLTSGLSEDLHTVKVLRRTEIKEANLSALISLSCDGKFYTPPEKSARKIDCYGASSICGYGNLGEPDDLTFTTAAEDGTSAFTYYTAAALGAQANAFCASGWGLGVGSTSSISDLFERYSILNGTPWNFDSYVPDVVIINLGYNDSKQFGTSGTQKYTDSREQFKTLLVDYLRKLYMYYPDSFIYVTYGIWAEYQIYDLYREAVKTLNDEGKKNIIAYKLYTPTAASGESEIGSCYHASYRGHKKMADALSSDIKERLGW